MLYLTLECPEKKTLFSCCSSATGRALFSELENAIGIQASNYFLVYNGQLVREDTCILNGEVNIIPRFNGGKGGFGSMLRAIGAQIEKTTNREACRDLSGRRLRDINEEKRLKSWLEKQKDRDDEAAERRRQKLEKLCAEPKHEFKDKNYDKQRSDLSERVEDAVEEGFKLVAASTSKRPGNKNIKSVPLKKKKMILDLDDEIDSDDLESSDESSDECDNKKDEAKKISLNLGDSDNLCKKGDSSLSASDGQKNNCSEESSQPKSDSENSSDASSATASVISR